MTDESRRETDKRNALPQPITMHLQDETTDVAVRARLLMSWILEKSPDWRSRFTFRDRQKWIRIAVAHENDPPENEGSAFAFIARFDFTNKQLGSVKAGDIMKPASWAKPAKHARGNVFDEDGGKSAIDLTTYGHPHVRYLG